MSDNTNYVQSVLGGLSGTFGNVWDTNMSQLVVDAALLDYGVDTEAEMTDTIKKKVLLNYETWVRVRDTLLLDPAVFKADGESFDFKVERLDKRVSEAKAKAMPYLPEGVIEQGRVSFVDDPYSIEGDVEHDA